MAGFHNPNPRLLGRLYRFGRMAICGCAALYAGLAIIGASLYTGPNFNVVGFAAQTLRADAFDMLSTIKSMLSPTDTGLGIGYRPVRYALVCQPSRSDLPAFEQENASNEARVRRQIRERSGTVHNNLTSALAVSGAQPVLYLQNADGGASICGARAYWLQNCECNGKSGAVARSKILAKDLFN